MAIATNSKQPDIGCMRCHQLLITREFCIELIFWCHSIQKMCVLRIYVNATEKMLVHKECVRLVMCCWQPAILIKIYCCYLRKI